MSDIRDFTGKNRKFTGTDSITLPKGTQAERVNREAGQLRFNTDTGLAEYYDGTGWRPIDAPPALTGVDPVSWVSDGSTRQTFTVSGSNLQSGGTAKFVGSDGTEYTSVNTVYVNNTTFTLQNMTTMGVANEPYSITWTNPSGLAGTLSDAIDAGSTPVFITAADTTVKSSYEGQSAPFSETTLLATDADAGQSLTYSISAGSLPPGLSLTSAGAIAGTISGSSVQNYTFTVLATDGVNTATRQFVFAVIQNPYITATGGTVSTSGDYKIHVFTSPGTFCVSAAGSPAGSDQVDYLVLAGGGAGGANNGGAGGAGGYREGKSPLNASPHTASPLSSGSGITISATAYPITVGGGGSANGGSGANSVFSTITSSGGGGGARDSGTGVSGGSGGGAGHDSAANPPGGSGNSPPVSPPQGNPGGAVSSSGGQWGGGGGGGALGSGAVGTPSNGGPGGPGTTSSISGTSTAYAAGGGGSSESGGNGSGQCGISGNGSSGSGGSASPANRGSGGGGANSGSGGNGSSGVVILRYKFQ